MLRQAQHEELFSEKKGPGHSGSIVIPETRPRYPEFWPEPYIQAQEHVSGVQAQIPGFRFAAPE